MESASNEIACLSEKDVHHSMALSGWTGLFDLARPDCLVWLDRIVWFGQTGLFGLARSDCLVRPDRGEGGCDFR